MKTTEIYALNRMWLEHRRDDFPFWAISPSNDLSPIMQNTDHCSAVLGPNTRTDAFRTAVARDVFINTYPGSRWTL